MKNLLDDLCCVVECLLNQGAPDAHCQEAIDRIRDHHHCCKEGDRKSPYKNSSGGKDGSK